VEEELGGLGKLPVLRSGESGERIVCIWLCYKRE
jgi:hypothetical protein